MKIAINCAFYQPKGGGVKEYIDNLVNNFSKLETSHEIVLYVLQDQLEYAKNNLPDKFKIKTIPFNSRSKLDRIKRSIFEKRFWLKEEETEKFDIFHSPFFHAPKLRHAKLLLTVHDLRLYRFPETYEFFRYQFLKRKVKSSIRRADHIISISDFTKQEITELCGVSPEKVTVILEAINQDRFSDKNLKTPNLPEEIKRNPFILAVGHLEPRKNYDRLIQAYNILRDKGVIPGLQLVIVGKKDHSYKETLQKIDATEGAHYLNFVETDTLVWLYKNASVFAFPSYYEGFGFPPLEAASLGTVSAVSNVSSIPEVCGEGAFYFDPYNEEEMAATLKEALTNEEEREKKLDKASQRLRDLSWLGNAEETLKVYDKIGV